MALVVSTAPSSATIPASAVDSAPTHDQEEISSQYAWCRSGDTNYRVKVNYNVGAPLASDLLPFLLLTVTLCALSNSSPAARLLSIAR